MPNNTSSTTVETKELVTTLAHMIGVKKHIVEQCFDAECHDTLQALYASQPATTIRYLNKLRTPLMLKFRKTDIEMRSNLMNLDRLEWYDAENIKQLEKWGVHVIKANYRAEKYANDLCELISRHIDACSGLFPDWVNWAYIRELFCIPHYTRKGVIKAETDKFVANRMVYPFQTYIYW